VPYVRFVIVLVYTPRIGRHGGGVSEGGRRSCWSRRPAAAVGMRTTRTVPVGSTRPIFEPIHPEGERVASVAHIPPEPDVRDAMPPRLRVHPCRRNAKESGDLLGGEEITASRDRLIRWFGHLIVSDHNRPRAANELLASARPHSSPNAWGRSERHPPSGARPTWHAPSSALRNLRRYPSPGALR
jgi:hypothetical protein